MALVDGELSHRPAEEPGTTENKDPHPMILRCRRVFQPAALLSAERRQRAAERFRTPEALA
ncbi:hypothetical protein GCM10011576_14010 [Micromonospora parathelypteridis]|nr:hypothetical protein GCM10011576_14010 [Micromonospora parathelypteridis]